MAGLASAGRRRWRLKPLVRKIGAPLMLASVVALGGCAPGGEGFWPSINPTSREAAGPPPRPFLSLLPENLWELMGGLGLLAAGGGVALFVWKFPSLLEEFANLRELADRLHERRDRSTADLAQISRRLTQIEQEFILLKRTGQRRAYPQAGQGSDVPVSRRFDPHHDVVVSGDEPPVPMPAVASPGQIAAAPLPLERVSHPVPAPLPVLATPAIATERPAVTPAAPARFDVSALRDVREPAGREERHEGLATERVAEPPGSAAASPAPPSPAEADPEPLDAATASQVDQPSAKSPTLATLIAAINGQGSEPIEGVTCVEMDIAKPSVNDELGGAIATRLRLVAHGGRFLRVLLDGDFWLFPTLETLATFRNDLPDEGIFEFLSDAGATPKLVRPALMREVGGLWEVSDLGEILVPFS